MPPVDVNASQWPVLAASGGPGHAWASGSLWVYIREHHAKINLLGLEVPIMEDIPNNGPMNSFYNSCLCFYSYDGRTFSKVSFLPVLFWVLCTKNYLFSGELSARCCELFLSMELSCDTGWSPFSKQEEWGPKVLVSFLWDPTQDCGLDHVNSGSDPWNLLLVLLLLLSLATQPLVAKSSS